MDPLGKYSFAHNQLPLKGCVTNVTNIPTSRKTRCKQN